MTFAMTKVLPEPVTPNRVENFFPDLMNSTSLSIASGWSPAGLNGDRSLNPPLIKKLYSLITKGQGDGGCSALDLSRFCFMLN